MKIGNNFAFKRAFDDTVIVDDNHEFASAQGIGVKTAILLGTAFITSLVLIALTFFFGAIMLGFYIIASIVSIVLQIIINLNPTKAKSLAIPYAISEGFIVGTLCAILEVALPGMGLYISGIALVATLSVFLAAVILYSKGVIRVGSRFRGFLLTASIGAIIFMLGLGILSLIFFFANGTDLYSTFYFSGFGVIVSIFMCVLASLYVIYSLSIADNLIESGADKKMEWFAAYAITLNVIYLFIEILRLLIILLGRSRRN